MKRMIVILAVLASLLVGCWGTFGAALIGAAIETKGRIDRENTPRPITLQDVQ